MSDNMKMTKGITYEQAITLVLQGRRPMGRTQLLEYFAEDEHGNVGRALDEMVVSGDVAFDRLFYKLQVRNS
jgi:hypothetical protein